MKFLVCKYKQSDNVRDIFDNAVKFSFSSSIKSSLCYIMPFCIITDGKDFAIFVDDGGSVHAGWCFKITSTFGLHFRSRRNFDRLTIEPIKKALKENFHYSDKFEIVCSEKAFYGSGNQIVHPVYFISLPFSYPVKFRSPEGQACLPVNIEYFMSDCNQKCQMANSTSCFVDLVNKGRISFPISNRSGEF